VPGPAGGKRKSQGSKKGKIRTLCAGASGVTKQWVNGTKKDLLGGRNHKKGGGGEPKKIQSTARTPEGGPKKRKTLVPWEVGQEKKSVGGGAVLEQTHKGKPVGKLDRIMSARKKKPKRKYRNGLIRGNGKKEGNVTCGPIIDENGCKKGGRKREVSKKKRQGTGMRILKCNLYRKPGESQKNNSWQ